MIFFTYYEGLKDLEDKGRIRRPCWQKESSGNEHIFFIVASNPEESQRLIRYLNSKSINAIRHYVPLHSSKAGKKYGKVSGSMDATDDMSQRVIRLPLFYGMKELEVDRVVQSIRDFFQAIGSQPNRLASVLAGSE